MGLVEDEVVVLDRDPDDLDVPLLAFVFEAPYRDTAAVPRAEDDDSRRFVGPRLPPAHRSPSRFEVYVLMVRPWAASAVDR